MLCIQVLLELPGTLLEGGHVDLSPLQHSSTEVLNVNTLCVLCVCVGVSEESGKDPYRAKDGSAIWGVEHPGS